MSHPVTTNPFIIMLINMTIVFGVLIALGLVINLIHMIDPTRKREEKKEEAPAVPEAPAAAEPVAEDGLTPEVVAVITAALASYGYGASQIHAIRPIESTGWKQSGRSLGVERL